MKDNYEPLVVILLASFNRAHLIGETLRSIKEQTYKNWECFITDDNSLDNSETVIKAIIKDDNRFSYYRKPAGYKQGLSGTRNFGLDLAFKKGARYIQFFDDDDLMHPLKLELQMNPFLDNPTLNFTVCKFEKLKIKDNGKVIIERPDYNLSHRHLGDAILTGALKMNSLSPLWNIEIFKEFKFDESLDYAEEWELYTRIGYTYPGNYSAVDKYLFQYRKHKDSITLGNDENFLKEKTSAIVRIKILHFLTKKKLHTKTSIKFLAITFSHYNYKPLYIKGLLCYVQENKLPYKLNVFLKFLLVTTKFNRKVFAKIATWI
ncbi:glycosyltransferase family 2 protein [Gramella sp. GC03-9]|uniref:Glycosyltransferase family 2 protein n=1 Tax=Christiangramia oceanisediminis TaxID=2920386 RepID=A0A9X2KVL4_9FLAO|nr:glycosyltransferase family 2 protein [Gramella oceanisediminis]MCP9198314.1 glycosyltransferase family 2 protein [Gramella oceanisediminis]